MVRVVSMGSRLVVEEGVSLVVVVAVVVAADAADDADDADDADVAALDIGLGAAVASRRACVASVALRQVRAFFKDLETGCRSWYRV